MPRSCKWRRVWPGVMLIAALLAGCTLDDGDGVPQTPPPGRADYAAQLDALQAAHADALALWDRLIDGQPVTCTKAIALPGALPARDDALLAEAIAAARAALAQSAARWDAECAVLGETVGLDAARDGRAAALQASDPLATAQALLDAWPTPTPPAG